MCALPIFYISAGVPAFIFIMLCRWPVIILNKVRATPHNSKCRYGERGAADAKPKAQIILDAAKVSAASGGNSEPKQGQRSQSARGFCPRSTMRVPQPDIIEHFGNADAVPQPPERCLSRQAGIVRCCLSLWFSARACRTWWPGGCQCFAAPVPAQPAAQLQKFPAPGYSGSSHS